MLFASLGEDESDAFLVCCGGIHALFATFIFLIFDFSAVFLTLCFYLTYTIDAPEWHNIIPSLALIISISLFPTGPYGLYNEQAEFLNIYLRRLKAITVFSFLWMFVCISIQEETIGLFISVIWLTSGIIYIFGSHFSSVAIDFLKDYKGFDGADPEVYERITGTPLE